MAPYPDAAVQIIFQRGLCVGNLLKISCVRRQRWEVAMDPISWNGKKMFIERAETSRGSNCLRGSLGGD